MYPRSHLPSLDASDSDNDDDSDDDVDEDPIVEHRSIPHVGGVNRVRAAPLPAGTGLPPLSAPYYVAAWSELGTVGIHDVRPLLEALDVPGYALDKARAHTPAHTVAAHGRAEGFALDWAASGPGSLRLLSGDVAAQIFLTTAGPAGFTPHAQPFTAHTASVEDLQWSPGEPTVFGSCSADRSVQVWDVRAKGRRSVAGIDGAHASDVNVISWNRSTSYLLLSGGDEGGIKVWDLRNVKKRGCVGHAAHPMSSCSCPSSCSSAATPDPTPVAAFAWHRAPITSIEWHPTDDSVFAAAGADDQTTLWDLSVEPDDDEAGAAAAAGAARDVPPQLLFAHQGQRDVKEVHWHPQIPGAVITTALDGFNVFKTISV
jgi:ribosome assembly protein RRB1